MELDNTNNSLNYLGQLSKEELTVEDYIGVYISLTNDVSSFIQKKPEKLPVHDVKKLQDGLRNLGKSLLDITKAHPELFTSADRGSRKLEEIQKNIMEQQKLLENPVKKEMSPEEKLLESESVRKLLSEQEKKIQNMISDEKKNMQDIAISMLRED